MSNFTNSIGGSKGSRGRSCNSVALSQASGSAAAGYSYAERGAASGTKPNYGAAPAGPMPTHRPTGKTHEQRANPPAKKKWS